MEKLAQKYTAEELQKLIKFLYNEGYFNVRVLKDGIIANLDGEGGVIENRFSENDGGTSPSHSFFQAAQVMSKQNLWALQETTSHSIVLKKWHGYVDSINDDEFTAVLTDPSGETPDVKASFSIDDVSEGDRDLVCENAMFDWVISRERKTHGQIENKDFLIFRRFMWKKSDLETKSNKVDAFNEWLNSSSTN